MSLKDNIKKIREEQWYMEDGRLEKIKNKLDKMNDEFWEGIALEPAKLEENFKNEPTYENMLLIENWVKKVYTLETKYNGYEAILKEPDKYNEIVEQTRKKLLDVDDIVNEIMEDRKNIFYLTNTEQIQLDVI